MAKYFYLDAQRNQQGPVEASELVGLGVTRSTLVWTEGMGEWQPAGAIGEIAPHFAPVAPPVYQAAPQPAPANYVHTNWLVWSILATIFCCLIGGIISIIYASNANSAYAAGNIAEAQKANNTAKTWFWVSFGIGLFCEVIAFIVYYAAIMASFGLGSSLFY
jgi:hypothetical protein